MHYSRHIGLGTLRHVRAGHVILSKDGHVTVHYGMARNGKLELGTLLQARDGPIILLFLSITNEQLVQIMN